MKPSDIIHNKAQEEISRNIATNQHSQYQQGYVDKLVSAILWYLDGQAKIHKEDIQITQGQL